MWVQLLLAGGIVVFYVGYVQAMKEASTGLGKHSYKQAFIESYLNAVLNILALVPLFLFRSRTCATMSREAGKSAVFMGLSARVVANAGLVTTMFAASNALNFLGLQLTSPGSAITFSSASAVFVYALSVVFLGESLTIPKCAAVAACLAGTAMTALGESSSSRAPHPVLGDILCGISGLLLAIGLVAFNVGVTTTSSAYMARYVGTMGLIAILTMWPGLLIQVYALDYPLELPSSGLAWAWVGIAQGALKILNILVFFGIPLASPLFIAVANLLCSPATVLIDAVRGEHSTALRLAGIGVVVLGFASLEYLRHAGEGEEKGGGEKEPLLSIQGEGPSLQQS